MICDKLKFIKIMKEIICAFLSLLCFANTGTGQDFDWESGVPTYAIVVGISDYKDEQRTDLQFAHRDAEAFADFLQSDAGGNVPPENIQLLTNEKATLAAIDNALNWLIEKPQKDDRVIIYFSGHGDVEKQTMWQLGYLLAFDTPFNNYRNNAVRLEDLNDLVTTLSVEREAEVMVITDACRSGKLAGSDNRGPSLTAEQLAKQSSNEVRIMSCKPDQKSFEGTVWGGGRGAFSWHFINGIKGMADEDGDLKITREEVEDYVKDKLKEAQRNQIIEARQTPQYTGDEEFNLAAVNQEILANLLEELREQADQPMVSEAFTSTPTIAARGEGGYPPLAPSINYEPSIWDKFVGRIIIGHKPSEYDTWKLFEDIGEPIDTPFVKTFVNNLPSSSWGNAEVVFKAFSESVIDLASKDSLSVTFKNKIAGTLHSIAQNAINDYLTGDAKEISKRYNVTWGEEYFDIPELLDLAIKLLNPDHLSYQKLIIKKHYFDGVKTRLKAMAANDHIGELNKALEQQKKTLALDDKAAFVHNELGLLYMELWSYQGFNKQELFEQAISAFKKALDLSPSWVLPYSNIAGLYAQKSDLANCKKWAEKAMKLKADYFGSYFNLGLALENEGDLLMAEHYYRKAIELAPAHYLPFFHMGYLSLTLGDYRAAEQFFGDAEARTNGVQPAQGLASAYSGFSNRSPESNYNILNSPVPFLDDNAMKELHEKVEQNPKDIESHYTLGEQYQTRNEFKLAEKHFRAVFLIQADFKEVYEKLKSTLVFSRQYEKAELLIKEQIRTHPYAPSLNFHLANLYRIWNRLDMEERVYRDQMRAHNGNQELPEIYKQTYSEAFVKLCSFLERFSRYREAEDLIMTYISNLPEPSLSTDLIDFYNRMIRRFPNEIEWLEKKAIYGSGKGTIKTSLSSIYERILEIDPDIPSKEHLYFKAGKYNYYTKMYEAAESAFKKAIEIEPSHLHNYFFLIKVYNESYQFDKAFSILEKLNKEGKIDHENRLLLGEYYARKDAPLEADTIARIAQENIFEDTYDFHKQVGKIYMIARYSPQSIVHFEKALAFFPENPEIQYSIASEYAKLGKPEQALEWLKKASQKFSYENVLKYDPDWNHLRSDSRFDTYLNYRPEPVPAEGN